MRDWYQKRATAFFSCVLVLAVVAPLGAPAQHADTKPERPAEGDARAQRARAPVVPARESVGIDLTDDVCVEIMTLARSVDQQRREIWFISVRRYGTRQDNVGPGYLENVYLKPETKSPRVRTGRYVSVENPSSAAEVARAITASRDANAAERIPLARASNLRSYCQVSLREAPFDAELGVPGGTLIPFDSPRGIEIDEVVNVVDFLREYAPASPGGMTRDSDEPILRIVREGDVIVVRRGYICGMLYGAGDWFRLKRTAEGLAVVDVGFWVS